MVVVAIIGILSAVAIPCYKKYVAKAKTTDAKMTLAQMWTSETTVFAEYATYAPCFTFFGFDCDAIESHTFWAARTVCTRNNSWYSGGFTASNDGNASWGSYFVRNNGGPSNCFGDDTDLTKNYGRYVWGKKMGQHVYDVETEPSSELQACLVYAPTMTTSTFSLCVAGFIGKEQDATTYLGADLWAIDQNKKLIHVGIGY